MPLTTRNSAKHRYQARRIAARATTPGGTQHCNVIDCAKPRLQAQGKGVGRYCLEHANHQRRHGHTTRASFTGKQLGSFRRAAWEWVTANSKDILVAHALMAIDHRLDHSGAVVEPNALMGLSARNRANAVWSRLRRREINPVVILSVAIAVDALLSLDPTPPVIGVMPASRWPRF